MKYIRYVILIIRLIVIDFYHFLFYHLRVIFSCDIYDIYIL